MPKAPQAKAAQEPDASPTGARREPDATPAKGASGHKPRAHAGKVAGRIMPLVGKIPAGTDAFCVHRLGAGKRVVEKISVDVGGIGTDEFPLEVLEQAGLEFFKSFGPGRYQVTWLGTDARGKRCSYGKSKRIEIGAPKAAAAAAVRPPPVTQAEREAEIFRQARQSALEELRPHFEIREKLQADGYKAIVEAMAAANAVRAQPTAPAAPSEDAINMKIELALLKARQAWEDEQREREDEEADEEDERAAEAAALATVAQNPDSLAAQIATIANVAKQLAPFLPIVAAFLAPKVAPAPVAVVTPPPAAPAQAAKPKRAPKPKPKADTHQETAAPAAAE